VLVISTQVKESDGIDDQINYAASASTFYLSIFEHIIPQEKNQGAKTVQFAVKGPAAAASAAATASSSSATASRPASLAAVHIAAKIAASAVSAPKVKVPAHTSGGDGGKKSDCCRNGKGEGV